MSATTVDRHPWYAEVRAEWAARGKPEIGEKVCRAWDIVHERVEPRDGGRVVYDEGERVLLDSDPQKVVSGMPHIEGDRVYALLLGDLSKNTWSVIERIEVL